jgi:hypothetical protein
MNRSEKSSFLDSVVNEIITGTKKSAGLNEYTIMGSHPGDGGVYHANSPEEAVAFWAISEYDFKNEAEKKAEHKKILKQIKDDTKAKKYMNQAEYKAWEEAGKKGNPPPSVNHMGIKETADGVWQAGDYEIKLVSKK